ncbi:hypothetical protein KKF38_02665 [Patescibacteria group bacterium]|nr:hypothetical protein [Patescibacteria group bacterium]
MIEVASFEEHHKEVPEPSPAEELERVLAGRGENFSERGFADTRKDIIAITSRAGGVQQQAIDRFTEDDLETLREIVPLYEKIKASFPADLESECERLAVKDRLSEFDPEDEKSYTEAESTLLQLATDVVAFQNRTTKLMKRAAQTMGELAREMGESTYVKQPEYRKTIGEEQKFAFKEKQFWDNCDRPLLEPENNPSSLVYGKLINPVANFANKLARAEAERMWDQKTFKLEFRRRIFIGEKMTEIIKKWNLGFVVSTW